MNLRTNFLIFILIFTFVSLGFATEVKSQLEIQPSPRKSWKQLPLRTSAQKEAGLMGGEGMQMVFSISYAPSNPNIAYFVANTSGVWKSTNGGFSWESKRNGFRAIGGISLVVDPLNENVVYVSGSRHSLAGSLTSPIDGIYRTLDGGESWQLIKQTAYYANKEGQHFVFDPHSYNGVRYMTVYAGTHTEGLLKSIDGGDSWIVLGMADKRLFDIELNLDTTNNSIILYVATNEGLYKVTDNGSVTISPLGNLPDYPRTIALNTQSNPDNDIIYAAVGAYKVYKSTDGGQTFISKNNGLTINKKEYKIISISKADPNYLYISADRLGRNNPFYSHDGGETWQQPTDLDENNLSITQGVYFASVTAPHPTDPDIALHNFAGASRISKTTNGGETWYYSGNGYMGGRRARNKTSTYFDPVNPDRKIFFLQDFGPAVTEDNGDTWELLPVPSVDYGGSTIVGTVNPDNQNIIITTVGTGSLQYIAKSNDCGSIWKFFDGTDGKPDTAGNYHFISFHPQDSNYVYAGMIYEDGAGTTRGRSWISQDGGDSWTFIDKKSIRAVFPDDGDIVYAIEACVDTDDPVEGCNQYRSILWRSDDKGGTWTWVAINPFKTDVYDVDIDPYDSNRLYAGKWDFYVYDGTEWTATGKSGGIPKETFGDKESFTVKSVVVDPINPNIVYAGMWAPGLGQRERFIYRSTDYGETWQDIGYNLDGYSKVWAMAVDPANGDLYISIDHGNYVFSQDLDGYR